MRSIFRCIGRDGRYPAESGHGSGAIVSDFFRAFAGRRHAEQLRGVLRGHDPFVADQSARERFPNVQFLDNRDQREHVAQLFIQAGKSVFAKKGDQDGK